MSFVLNLVFYFLRVASVCIFFGGVVILLCLVGLSLSLSCPFGWEGSGFVCLEFWLNVSLVRVRVCIVGLCCIGSDLVFL